MNSASVQSSSTTPPATDSTASSLGTSDDGWDTTDAWVDDQNSGASPGNPGPSLAIVPVSSSSATHCVNISMGDRAEDQRVPADVCCVVDISGSMGSLATYENEDGSTESDGLTILDIVKHAVKSVMHLLSDDDRLSLVVFDNKSETVVPLTHMTEDGRAVAVATLEEQQTRGSTNIWGGLRRGMDSLRTAPAPNVSLSGPRTRTVLLLTDGQPNVQPPNGLTHDQALVKYFTEYPHFSCAINTFGFGYALNSELLVDLAKGGNGTFAFIPDALIVGTTFVNSVANVLSNATQSAKLTLSVCNGATFRDSSAQSLVSDLGPLQQGQDRQIPVSVCVPASTLESGLPYLEAVLKHPSGCIRAIGSNESSHSLGPSSDEAITASIGCLRSNTVLAMEQAITLASAGEEAQAQATLAAALSAITAADFSPAGGDDRLEALKADVEGRATKALQGLSRFNRWGKHYLRALARAHQLQQCTNFMDVGLQIYGGELFHSLRDQGDAVFLALPMPTPPQQRTVSTASTSACAQTACAPSSATYYGGSGGGCFGPSSTVMAVPSEDSSSNVVVTPIAMVRAGDRVLASGGELVTVRCVVRIDRTPSKGLVVLSNGLTITPRHPIKVNGIWMLPQDLSNTSTCPNPSGVVFNLVLETNHVLLVNGIECITWGHKYADDVLQHPFFGTEAVLADLAAMPGWSQGLVHVTGCMRAASGQVVGLRTVNGPSPTCDAPSSGMLGSGSMDFPHCECVH